MRNRYGLALWATALCSLVVPPLAMAQDGDPAVLARMQAINQQLHARGLGIAVEQIEFFTIGGGRPANRIHAQPFRWVADDPRRLADGDKLTYLVDQSDGATASGLSSAQTEAAIDRSLDTWQSNRCFKKVDIVKRADNGEDPDIFDSFFGFGGFGNPFLADITEAGWLPRALDSAAPVGDVTVASVSSATTVKQGFFRGWRMVNLMSFILPSSNFRLPIFSSCGRPKYVKLP